MSLKIEYREELTEAAPIPRAKPQGVRLLVAAGQTAPEEEVEMDDLSYEEWIPIDREHLDILGLLIGQGRKHKCEQ